MLKLDNHNIILPKYFEVVKKMYKSAPNSPQTKRGANGKFLPKPLLFHLRHPNSKTNEPKFWQILSPKNSFAKTSSALFRHLPEYLEGRTPKKNVLSIFKKNFTPAKSGKQGTFFFGVAEALRGSGGTIHSRSKKVRANAKITPQILMTDLFCLI